MKLPLLRPEELLGAAADLAVRGGTQAHLRRSVSTSYYALFHWLAICCADMLVGTDKVPRSARAWRHVYRRLEHGKVRNRCEQLKGDSRGFPASILKFAEQFVTLQEKRELADYDPYVEILKTEALAHVQLAIVAIQGVRRTRVKDRRAFAVWVLFDRPRGG